MSGGNLLAVMKIVRRAPSADSPPRAISSSSEATRAVRPSKRLLQNEQRRIEREWRGPAPRGAVLFVGLGRSQLRGACQPQGCQHDVDSTSMSRGAAPLPNRSGNATLSRRDRFCSRPSPAEGIHAAAER